jgi:hypothetical protein
MRYPGTAPPLATDRPLNPDPLDLAVAACRGARSTCPWTAASAAATPFRDLVPCAMGAATPSGSATSPW